MTSQSAAAGHDAGVAFRKLRKTSDPTSFFPKPDPKTEVLPAGSTYGPGIAPLGSRWHGGRRKLPVDIECRRDVQATLRNGDRVYLDIYLPPGATNVPAIVSWSPYGKRGGFWSYGKLNPGAVPSLDRVSGLQKFEGVDPAEWVARGYAVIHPDPPGAFGSPGLLRTWGEAEAEHVYDVIEWLAVQDWCSGRVGMAGNSWLGISQWFAAAARPPHLAAIAPWNGFFDIYDFVSAGGVPGPLFAELLTRFQWGDRMEDLPSMIKKYPLKNEYWDAHDARLEDIEVPAYVVHAYPLGVHRWTPEAFRRLGSEKKWLRLNNTHEWWDLYDPAYVADLAKFFDRYLRNIDNDWESTPRVRLSVLDPSLGPGEGANPQDEKSKGYVPAIVIDRPEQEWPLARTVYTDLSLDGSDGSLTPDQPADAATREYRATKGEALFSHRFIADTELTGYASALLWVEAREANDADLFLDLSRLDSSGKRIGLFETAVIRASHRDLDPARSTEFLPQHTHRAETLLRPGEIVPVHAAFAPASMLFRAGDQIQLRVAGTARRWLRDPAGDTLGTTIGTLLWPKSKRNSGTHVIHTGGDHQSYVRLPIIPAV